MKKQEWKDSDRQRRIEGQEEIWKDIPGYEGLYQVSNKGQIKSFYTNRLRRIVDKGNGYKHIMLSKDKKFKSHNVHRLVMLAFVGESKLEVNHLNGNPSDNNLENLEYCTGSENKKHSYKYLGRKTHLEGKFGILNHNSKKVLQFDMNKNFLKEWHSMADIERELGLFHGNISKCCNGSRKSVGKFVFKFKI